MRDFEMRRADLRALSSNRIGGYGAVFNSMSEDLGGFVEVVRPGAFKGVLSDDVRGLINHNPDLVLGRSTAGTLRFREDTIGLAFEVDLGEQSYANDLRISMARGDITQCSFMFTVAVDRWSQQGKVLLREVIQIDRLYDLSVVTFPAYPAATAALRSDKEVPATLALRKRRLELAARS